MTRSSPFDTAFLVAATGGTPVGKPSGERVLTDSREDVAGALFVAITGERFDGHDFVPEVLQKGGRGVVVAERWHLAYGRGLSHLLVVPDTLEALHALARAHRARRPIPLVAITGSNGKTTTKELLALALSPLGPVLKTRGNRNNHIGLPLTLLELTPEHRGAAVEIGLNHPGEMRHLAGLASPQVAVITNVSEAHLEGLGSVDGVARAKAEIAEALPDGGVLVVPAGFPPLERALAGYRGKRVTFGMGEDADVRIRRWAKAGEGMRVELTDGTTFFLPLLGEHGVRNALAALAAADALGVPPAEAAPLLAGFRPAAGRLAPEEAGGVTLLDDTYNANPASLAASLAVLREAETEGRRWAILGDMLELGPDGPALHRRAGAGASFVDGLITVGTLAREIGEGAAAAGLDPERIQEAADGERAAALLAPRLAPGDVVLVKGSRGMRLETAMVALRRALGGKV